MKFHKFKLLCWKNFTLQKRHKVAGIFEILFPIFIVFTFVASRKSWFSTMTHPEILFSSYVPELLSDCRVWYNIKITTVAVSPDNNEELKSLVKDAIGTSMTVKFFKDASALNKYLQVQPGNGSEVAVGLEFSEYNSVSDD